MSKKLYDSKREKCSSDEISHFKCTFAKLVIAAMTEVKGEA